MNYKCIEIKNIVKLTFKSLSIRTLETLRNKVFHVFVKTPSRLFWPGLAILSYNLWYWTSIFSILGWTVILPSQFASASIIFSFVLSMTLKSLRVPLMWSFWQCHFLFSFLFQMPFLIYVNNFTFIKFFWLHT